MNRQIFWIYLWLCVFTHIIRSVYEILKYKKLILPNNFTFIIILLNMLLLWSSWFGLCSTDIIKINMPDFIKYLGLLLFLFGIIVFITGLLTIKSLESYNGDLITKGIYSKIRHPMYLGFILWVIGLPVYYGAVVSFFLSFLFIFNILFWRYLEEIELVKRFPDYSEYKITTIF